MIDVKFKEIIEFAIEREKEAVKFYEDVQKLTKHKASIELLQELAEMEKGHMKILERFNPEDAEHFEPSKIQDLKISDYLVKSVPTTEMTYQEVLVTAMKREESAKNLYAALADQAEDENMKNLFLKLSEEEAKHKLQLEQIYDDEILLEN